MTRNLAYQMRKRVKLTSRRKYPHLEGCDGTDAGCSCGATSLRRYYAEVVVPATRSLRHPHPPDKKVEAFRGANSEGSDDEAHATRKPAHQEQRR